MPNPTPKIANQTNRKQHRHICVVQPPGKLRRQCLSWAWSTNDTASRKVTSKRRFDCVVPTKSAATWPDYVVTTAWARIGTVENWTGKQATHSRTLNRDKSNVQHTRFEHCKPQTEDLQWLLGCIGTSSCSAVHPEIGSSGEHKGCEAVAKGSHDSIDGAAPNIQNGEQSCMRLFMLESQPTQGWRQWEQLTTNWSIMTWSVRAKNCWYWPVRLACPASKNAPKPTLADCYGINRILPAQVHDQTLHRCVIKMWCIKRGHCRERVLTCRMGWARLWTRWTTLQTQQAEVSTALGEVHCNNQRSA